MLPSICPVTDVLPYEGAHVPQLLWIICELSTQVVACIGKILISFIISPIVVDPRYSVQHSSINARTKERFKVMSLICITMLPQLVRIRIHVLSFESGFTRISLF